MIQNFSHFLCNSFDSYHYKTNIPFKPFPIALHQLRLNVDSLLMINIPVHVRFHTNDKWTCLALQTPSERNGVLDIYGTVDIRSVTIFLA